MTSAPVVNLIKHFTVVIFGSRVVLTRKLTLGSKFMLVNVF